MEEPSRLGDIVGVHTASLLVLASITFFHIVSKIVNTVPIPENVLKKGHNEVWKWRNLSISWVHALIVGTWDLSCFYFYPELQDDLILHIKPYTYYLLLFSTGYFLYDFVDVLVSGKAFKMWELTLHHIAVLSTFLYNIYTQRYIGYTVVALLTEVNSIFLHFRKLTQMQGYAATSVYRVNAWVNAVTYVLFRGYALTAISVGMIIERARIDPMYFWVLTGSMVIMDVINPILFWILFKNDFLTRNRSRAPKMKTEANGHVGMANGKAFSLTNGNDNKLTNGNDHKLANGNSITG